MHTPACFIILWFTLYEFNAHNHITKAEEISITSTGCNKQIQWKGDYVFVSSFRDALWECEFFKLDNQDINVQFHSHSKVSEAKASDECCKELENRTEHSHGVLKIAQIIPLWYLRSYEEKRVSCTGMNVILVWKSIADRQLKMVDLYIGTVINFLSGFDRADQSVTFGVYDEYAQSNYTLVDAKYQQIPIPKIIYRVIRGWWNEETYSAVVIIHNEPAYVPDSDKLCDSIDMLSGWDMITNNDPKSGLTYVCQLTRELNEKFSIGVKWSNPLNLDAIPYSEKPYRDHTCPIEDYNITGQMNYVFDLE